MSVRKRRGLVAGLAALALCGAACSENVVEPDPLLPEEVTALAVGLAALGAFVPDDFEAGVGDAPCSGGGSVRVSGGVTGDLATQLQVDVTMTPDACVFTSEGYTFTLWGDPHIRQAGTISFGADLLDPIQIDIAITGGVNWQLSSKSGACAIDLTVDAEANPTTGATTGPVAGTLCGASLNLDIRDLREALTVVPGGA